MRMIAGAGLAIAAVALLAGCTITTTQSAPVEVKGGIATANPAPTSTPMDLSCPTGTATLNMPNSVYMLAKNCVDVIITGSSMRITGAALTKVSISGNFNAVVASSVGKANIEGQTNTITSATFGTVSLNGDYNTIDASGTVNALRIEGNNNTVSSTNTIAGVTQSGSGNVVAAGG